uniref:Uncharacterized protein n=1 Tax=Saimiri boliviensis boliviensis TaxID=39432 RepID=A0A2K6SWC4_SAIBB
RASLNVRSVHQGHAFRAGNVIGQLIYLLTWSLFTAWLQPPTQLQARGRLPRGPHLAQLLCEMKIRSQRHEGPAWGGLAFLRGLHLAPSSLSPAACGMKRLWAGVRGWRRRDSHLPCGCRG